MKSRLVLYLAASLFLVSLWGCGSNLESGGDQTAGAEDFGTDANGIKYVSAKVCTDCHAGFSWSEQVVKDYLQGKHVIHIMHITAESDSSCLQCHDPIGDGPTLEGLIAEENVPEEGLAAVTCEACHGAGGEHYGVAPLPTPKPKASTCGPCHDAQRESHLSYFPESNNIYSDYQSSAHALPEALPEELQEELRNETICVKCHNDEGGRAYKDVMTYTGLTDVALPLPGEVSPIQCRTCHNAHYAGKLLKEDSLNRDGEVTESAEYNTCTNCHQRHDATVSSDPSPGATSDGPSGDLIYHAKRWDRVIASTHNDDPATYYLEDEAGNVIQEGKIEGYAMDTANERVCRDCHNVHSADLTINNQWANSGHGGQLLAAKEAAAASQESRSWEQVQAVRAAGSTSSWAADPWPTEAEASCQRCHTATGGKNFMDNSVAYIKAFQAYLASGEDEATRDESLLPNDFSYLEEGQQELLFCWGCHTNNAGGMRGVGQSISLPDRDYYIMAVVPNVGKSSVCVGCHGGRANRGYIAGLPNADRSRRALVHYRAASGTLFSEITHTGYEYDVDGDFDFAEHYQNPSYFKHDAIGLNGDTPETGVGPCAGCHMNEAGHSFAAVTVDATSNERTITNQALCNTCHTGNYVMSPAKLEEESTGFQNALALLLDYVDGSVSGTVTNYKNLDLTNQDNLRLPTTSARDYGAHQNQAYLAAEPGAYAHNRYYAKRLIFDSIDWLDNGKLDGQITINVTNYPEAAAWFNADDAGVASRP